jgi:tetratricopeptide (TPR) repeat protein
MANNDGGGDTIASLGEELPIKIDKDAVVVSARQRAMENYWDFMNSAPEDSLRVEALRRLADLELERSEEQYQIQLEEMVEQEKKITRADQIELKGANYEKAIELYEKALQASADGGLDDPQILYQLSKAYEQVGEPEKALQALNRLLSSFPDIDNRDEVHFRRGELLFQQKKFKLAELAYSQAMVVSPSSPYYEKALSQRGWSAYKQGKYKNALFSFFNIVDRKLRDPEGGVGSDDSHLSRGEKELLEDTFRVILLSFNELGGPPAVTRYFDEQGHRPYEPRVYKMLGDYYLEQERIKDSAQAYYQFVKTYPNDPRAPEFDLFAIKAYAAGGFASLALDAKLAFAERYRINGPYWQAQPIQVREQLVETVAANMEDLASHYHAVAQKSKSNADYQKALVWYRQYLKSFPNSRKAAEVNFLLAEALYENKQYDDAAKEYEKTAYQYVKSGKNAEAGYAALVAYNDHAKTLQGKQKEIWERLTIASALRFGKAFPDDSRAPKVVTKAAEDLFKLKKYDQAAVAARTILELTGQNTSNEMRRTAWLIVAQSELENGKYAEAESAYKIAMTMAGDDQKVRKTINEGIAAAIYKRGEALREAGNTAAAQEQFQRIAKVAPNSQANIAAQFDITAAYLVNEEYEKAAREFEAFRRKYPNHHLQQRVTENLAVAYVKTDKPLWAAEELKKLMTYQSNDQAQREMLWQVSELYEQAGDHQKMIETYESFVRTYPHPVQQASEARHKLATVYKQMGNEQMYQHWLKQIIKQDKFAGDERTERTTYLAAKAAFTLAQPTLTSFREVQLVAPLQQNLKRKKQRMQEAVDAFTQAANYGVEEVTTASVYLLGEIYRIFGQELLKSERPSGLSPEEREQYDILLEEQAYPFEEKSIDIHESNVQRVKDGTYDEWVQKSFAALEKLRPVRYAKAERSELFINRLY